MDQRHRSIPGWLISGLVTFAIVGTVTLTLWWRNQAVLADIFKLRIAEAQTRVARRLQREMDGVIHCGLTIQAQVSGGWVSGPNEFRALAGAMLKNQSSLRSIDWLDASGVQLARVEKSESTGSIINEISSDRALDLPPLMTVLVEHPGGFFVSQRTSTSSDESIVFPILPVSPRIPTRVEGAVRLSAAPIASIDRDLPADLRTHASLSVTDRSGVPLSGSDAKALVTTSPESFDVLNERFQINLNVGNVAALRRRFDNYFLPLFGSLGISILSAVIVGYVVWSRQRLTQGTRSHVDALEELNKIAALIGSTVHPPDQVLHRLLTSACTLLKIPKAFVVESEGGDSIRRMASYGFFDPPMDWERRHLDVTPGIARCIRTREPIYFVDVESTHIPTVNLEKLARYHIRAVMMFPMVAGPDVIGVVVFADSNPRMFTEWEKRLARLWVSQTTVTFVNQRLARASEVALHAQQRLNVQVQNDARAKEDLLLEMNHRVKNNMAGIVGLLSDGMPDLSEQAHRWLDRAISRIQTLAGAHELFVKFAEEVSLLTLIDRTLAPIHAMMPTDAHLRIDGNIAAKLSTEKAVTLAMVLHELATNALEHGIGPAGVLSVRISRTATERVRIEIIDDGSHVSPSPEMTDACDSEAATHPARLEARSGRGLELVQNLVGREMKGTFRTSNGSGRGRTATIEFPALPE